METRTSLAHLASLANDIGRYSRRDGAPVLTAKSTRETLLEWLIWNDPNGLYTDENNEREDVEPLTLLGAWREVESVVLVD